MHTHMHVHLHTGTIAVTSGLFNDLSQSPIVSGVQCTGSEIDLLSCSHSNSIDRSSCGTHNDAGVVCQGKLQWVEHSLYLKFYTKGKSRFLVTSRNYTI